jgi:starch synthase
VLPSLHESFGCSLIEAALAGLPTVATRIDGIPEIVVDGETGILVTPTEPVEADPRLKAVTPIRAVEPGTGRIVDVKAPTADAIAGAVLEILGDRIRAGEMGRSARLRALENFTLKRYAGDLEKLYVRLAEERGVV